MRLEPGHYDATRKWKVAGSKSQYLQDQRRDYTGPDPELFLDFPVTRANTVSLWELV